MNAIEAAMARYAAALDDRDWGALDSVFADEIELVGGEAPLRGRAAFIAMIRTYLDTCGPTQHLLGQTSIEGRCSTTYFRALHCDAEAATKTFEVVGRYHVEWTETAAGPRARRWRYQPIARFGDASVLGRTLPAR